VEPNAAQMLNNAVTNTAVLQELLASMERALQLQLELAQTLQATVETICFVMYDIQISFKLIHIATTRYEMLWSRMLSKCSTMLQRIMLCCWHFMHSKYLPIRNNPPT
jgi:hypothetical protein